MQLLFLVTELHKICPKWMMKIMENPIKMDDLGGVSHIFGNTRLHPAGLQHNLCTKTHYGLILWSVFSKDFAADFKGTVYILPKKPMVINKNHG